MQPASSSSVSQAVRAAVTAARPQKARLFPLAITCGLATLFLVLRIWRLTDVSLDGDEIFSLLLARSDWHTLFAGAIKDAIHPPFFYVLLKMWVGVGGESLLWIRLFPVAVSLLCLVPAFLLCKDLRIPRGARNLALLIVSVHPYALFFAQHMRMYCLLELFGLTSIWAFERFLRDRSRRSLVILSAANLLMVYTHYYGWLIMGLEFLYLLWRKRNALLPFAVASLFVAALFGPWAWLAAQSLHAKGGLADNLGWVPRPGLRDLSWFYVEISGLNGLLRWASWTAVALLAFLYWMYRRRKDADFHWLVVICLAPALVTYAVSQWLPQSIWGSRHLIFALWPFVLLLADVVWRLRSVARTIALALVAAWMVFSLKSYSPEELKIHWDRLTLAMLDAESTDSGPVTLYTVDPYLHYPIWFHLESLKDQRLAPLGSFINLRKDMPLLRAKAARFAVQKVTSVDAARGGYFWLGYVESGWKGPVSPRQMLEQRGCQTGDEIKSRDRFQSITLFPVKCSEGTP